MHLFLKEQVFTISVISDVSKNPKKPNKQPHLNASLPNKHIRKLIIQVNFSIQ